jgi:HK97 family phage prohead protease
MKTNLPDISTRIQRRFTPGTVEVRAAEPGEDGETPARRIVGYGAKFGNRSQDMGYGGVHVFEVIEPGFFDNVLGDDVRCLFNHDSNLILGRTASKTTRISQDETGLAYDCDADDEISYVRDLLRSLARGDVNQSSFAFTVDRDGVRWEEEGDTITRYLLKGGCRQLADVSPVTYPAYTAATSEARGLVEMTDLIAEARQSGALSSDATDAARAALTARYHQRNRHLDLLAHS